MNRGDIPSNISKSSKDSFFNGLKALGSSVESIREAGEFFARIEDEEWKTLKMRMDGEVKKWAQNARDVIKKGLHPAFALMTGVIGRKARKLSSKDQELILRQPIEIAVLTEEGRIKDKKLVLASDLTSSELDRAIAEDNSKAWICSPQEQASKYRAKLKALENKEAALNEFVIQKPAYTINKKGVKLNKNALSFGQFQELVDDVEKIKAKFS
ncbi:hypothetical protein OAI07_01180 [Akkermansiaceae bacterium]|nr:hypothetical protein [Akkermansiaceae bacterium]